MIGVGNSILDCAVRSVFGAEQRAIAIARQYGGVLLYAKSTLSNLFQNSNGTGAVTTTGDPIGLWQDSAMSFNASQATGANKPLLTRLSNNLLLWTEGFDNAYWGKQLSNVTANTDTAPDGTLTSDAFIGQAFSGVHKLFVDNVLSAVTGAVTLSVSVKAKEYRRLVVVLSDANNSSNGVFAVFNAHTGVWDVASSLFGLGWGTGSVSVVAQSNGYYRISLTATRTTSGTVSAGFQIDNATSGGLSNNFLGDGTSGIFVRGANLTQSSSVLPYEPADAYPRVGNFAISTNGTNQFMTITSPPQITGDFTVVWAGNVGNLSTSRLLLSGNTANRLSLEVTTVGAISVYGVGGLIANSAAEYVTTSNAVCSIRRTLSGLEFRRNGVVINTVSGTFTFAAVTSMHLFTNSTLSAAFFLGNTAEYFIANQALPDADLLQIERFGAQRLGITI